MMAEDTRPAVYGGADTHADVHVAAAVTALRLEDCGTAKADDGPAGELRALRAARRGALKARTQAMNQLTGLLVSAPDLIRVRLDGLRGKKLAAACAALAGSAPDEPAGGTVTALASITGRWLGLDAEGAGLDAAMTALVTRAAPALLAKAGAGPQSAAALIITAGDNPARIRRESSLAALRGVSPAGCSSGRQQRHRLNQGGDRQADSALWRIVQSRLQHDPRTQAYLDKRTREGKTARRSPAASNGTSPARSGRHTSAPPPDNHAARATAPASTPGRQFALPASHPPRPSASHPTHGKTQVNGLFTRPLDIGASQDPNQPR
jgi:transposase